MTASKSKKALIILIVSILLLCAAVGICIYLFTLPQGDTWSEPIDTEVLLPEPDYVVFYCDNQKYVLSQAAQEMVYETVSNWLTNVQGCAHEQVEHAWQISALRFEFYYQGPYRYVGSLGTEELLSKEPFVYSAIAFGGGPSATVVTPYINDEYFGIDDTKTTLIFDIDRYAWDNLVVKALLAIPHENVNAEILESNAFPAKPDSIVVYHGGQAMELAGEEFDTAYERFAQMTKNSIVSLNRGIGLPGRAASTIVQGTCIELRYNRRQKCITDQEYSETGGSAGVNAYYKNQAYDALLFFMFDGGSFPELQMAMYTGNSYDFLGLVKESWSYDAASYADLMQYIAGLVK